MGYYQETNNQHSHTDIQELKVHRKHLKDQQDIADAFKNYFSSVIENIIKSNKSNKSNNENVHTFQYYLEQNFVYPPPFWGVIKTFSTKEITSMIKALKTKSSHAFDEIPIQLLKSLEFFLTI